MSKTQSSGAASAALIYEGAAQLLQEQPMELADALVELDGLDWTEHERGVFIYALETAAATLRRLRHS